MEADSPDGLEFVEATELPQAVLDVVGSAREFVQLVGVSPLAVPGLLDALYSALRRRVCVTIVVTARDAVQDVRRLERIAGAGATVLADGDDPRFLVASESKAIELPTRFEDVPRPGTTAASVTRPRSAARWQRVAARARLAQLGTRRIDPGHDWRSWQHRLTSAVFRTTVPVDEF